MDYNQTLEYIHSLGFFSKPPSLDRIKAVLFKLSNPQRDLKVVHIAGTNGKGSTAVMTANILQNSGFKTGLFVSPYIIDFRERISINGEYIPKEELVELSSKVISTEVKLTEFEFITAVAFLYYSKEKCDIVVLETGLGGRLDATNACENVISSVITKIGLDHTAILGETLSQIAKEKCGIIKNSVTVSYPLQEKEALDVIKETAQNLIIPDINSLEISKNEFIYKGEKYRINLFGRYQIYNAITAIETVKNLNFDIGEEDIKNGLSAAFIPARLEIISESPLVVLDGSHNPDGAQTVVDFMKEIKGEKNAVIGVMKDKNYKDLLSKTVPFLSNIILVTPKDIPRALSAKELAKAVESFNKNVIIAYSMQDAVEKAKEISKNNPLFVFGSLYLASQIRPILKSAYK